MRRAGRFSEASIRSAGPTRRYCSLAYLHYLASRSVLEGCGVHSGLEPTGNPVPRRLLAGTLLLCLLLGVLLEQAALPGLKPLGLLVRSHAAVNAAVAESMADGAGAARR